MNQRVVSQQTMSFPSAEERNRLRAAAGMDPAQIAKHAAAQAGAALLNPQTQGAVVSPPRQVQQVQQSPRVQQMHNGAGTLQNPRPGPTVDPSLVEALQAPVQQQAQSPAPVVRNGPRPVQEFPPRETQWHESPRPYPMAADVKSEGVRNPMPGYVVPLADSGGTSFALPSRFAYYPFKDLYIVPFRNMHQAKLQRAATEKSMQPVVEAVATVCYTSDPSHKHPAFDLSVPDFYAVLYWLRFNSFTKMTFTHKDMCRDHEHLRRVKAGELDEKTLLLQQIVDKTMLKTHELEYIPDPAEYNLGEDSPFYIAPPTMRDVLEFLEHPMMRDANTRVEFAYLAQKVSHIHGKAGYVSLDDRIEWYENESPDLGVMLDDFRDATKSYGVEEFIHMNCKVCGASRKSNLVLDASAFLSSNRR